jgi:hypothetical protein
VPIDPAQIAQAEQQQWQAAQDAAPQVRLIAGPGTGKSATIERRLCRIFLRGPDGRRPVYGGISKFQADPHWRDLILFHEYFHGDNGAGIGASHQTGWTGVVAWLIKSLTVLDPKEVLEKGFDAAAMKMLRGH